MHRALTVSVVCCEVKLRAEGMVVEVKCPYWLVATGLGPDYGKPAPSAWTRDNTVQVIRVVPQQEGRLL